MKYSPKEQTYHLGSEEIGENWLDLDRNENLFIEQNWLAEIGKEVLSTLNVSQYPDSSCTRLRKRLADIYKVDFDQVYIGNGSDEILAGLLYYLRSQFSEAVTPEITYRIYPFLLQRYGYKQLTLEKANQECLCLIDSPNSLTGESSKVFDIPSSFLIWDNVYGEIAKEQINTTNIDSSTVIIRSFSKFYGLANLRVGYCLADSKVVHELMKRKDIYNVNGFAQEMALRVLDQKQFFDSLVPKITLARKILEEGLKALGFLLSNSQTNCVWATHPFITAELLQSALENHNIVVRRFPEFNLYNHLRITVPPLEKVFYLLEVIRKCL